MINKSKLIGDALVKLVDQARTGNPKARVGLMAAGNELGAEELLRGAVLAMAQDFRLQVVAIGAEVPGYDCLEWIETPNSESAMAAAMEWALAEGLINGAVALHYPFPLGVTTIGRVMTPARGKPLLIASSTGMSALSRMEAMLRNAVYAIAVAKALNMEKPSVGILNLDSAASVQRALVRLSEGGYAIHLGGSGRADGGSLLRGNDLLAGTVDVCVCDTLTGNVLMKLFSAFNTGGNFEALGWGYGPSVGEKWVKIISIISRVSGAPVIANALCYTASLIRGDLVHCVQRELAAAKTAGLDEIISSIASTPLQLEEISVPTQQPTNSEIQGVDVLSIEAAVKELWKVGIYAESGMGCTGPVIKVPGALMERCREVLSKTGYL
jgi:glycine/sarcosine/betaine reductase complex component C subunit alpha